MERVGRVKRQTRETNVEIDLALNGKGKFDINTGIGFFNHMLETIAKHAALDLVVDGSGDINVDYHHLVEDTGIAFGSALKEALGDMKGVSRFGYASVPLDEALVEVSLDLSGRPYYKSNFSEFPGSAGDFNIELADVFFGGFASKGYTLHIVVMRGENRHHIIEAGFKAFAKSLKMAIEIDKSMADSVPSTKDYI
ncbi:MAG: imidazoleglycerol-phosphate dehydratase HisB [Brevinematia bacterium]